MTFNSDLRQHSISFRSIPTQNKTTDPSDNFNNKKVSYNLTVKAVVNTVNNVFGSGFLGSESALVLLDHFLLCGRKSWDAVHIGNTLVRTMGDNLSGSTGVHARQTEVGADIGVVKVNDGTATEVGNIFVVDLGVGSGGDGGGGDGEAGGTEEGTTITLGVERGLGHVLCVGGERGGRAAL